MKKQFFGSRAHPVSPAQIDPMDDPLSERALDEWALKMHNGGYVGWKDREHELRRRADERLAAVEAAHNGQIQALTKRIEELEAK
jgi:hypothetical protein